MLRHSVVASLTCLAAIPAHAFSVATSVTRGCHEKISLDASRRAGVVADTASVTAADRTLLASLPFPVEGPWDRSTLALLIGIRDNDFHGVAASNFQGLSDVHFSPALQQEHCLRTAAEDGADGDRAALALCRAYISSELRLAALALPGSTEQARVALIDETVLVDLPASELHLGRALHAVQDSFAHSIRDENFTTVRSVFNYLDPNIGTGYQPNRDGHGHVSEFDSCEGGLAADRAEAATAATTELIVALSRPGATPAARVAEAQLALDRRWNYTPACEDGTAWCASAEQLLQDRLVPAPSGCSSTGNSPSWTFAVTLLGLLALRKASRRAIEALVVISLVALPTLASAEEPSVEHVVEVTRQQGTPPLRFRPSTSLGLSVDRGAGIVAVGLRLPLNGRFELFGDLELNPWFDVLAGKVNWGALNAVFGASLRWATIGPVELRSGLGLGASLLLHDTVSAQAGTVGPFAQLSVINVLFPGPGSARFELRPDAVLSIPSLRGIPLVYHQYRMVLTLRLG